METKKCYGFCIANFKQIENARLYLAKDGTEILDEEYFTTIVPQTVIVIAGKNDFVKTGNSFYFENIFFLFFINKTT